MANHLTHAGRLTLPGPSLRASLRRLARLLEGCIAGAREARALLHAAKARYPFVDW